MISLALAVLAAGFSFGVLATGFWIGTLAPEFFAAGVLLMLLCACVSQMALNRQHQRHMREVDQAFAILQEDRYRVEDLG